MLSPYWMLLRRSGCLALLALLLGCEAPPPPAYVHRVAAAPLQAASEYSVERRLAGRVEARQRVDLGFELAGTLASVPARSGDRVAKGQLLATLDQRLLRDEQTQLQATFDELEARAKLNALELKRQQKLLRQGFAAEQRMDELRAEAQVIAAQLKRQQALINALATRLAKSQLLAPYDADVGHLYLDEGAVVSAGKPVLQLLERGALEAVVGVPPQLAEGLVLEQGLWLDYAGQRVEGRLLSIGRTIDPVTRTVELRLHLPSELPAVDGGLVFLALQDQRQQAGYWLPASALVGGVRGMWNVLAMLPVGGEADRFELQMRSVTVLHRAGERVYVSGPLADVAQVVGSGTHRVVQGQVVRTEEAARG
jgi:RND family efflux transporter MFP subunit